MPVSSCKRCHEEITVPPGLAPSSEVQCPLCKELFELSEVLDGMPPALIVVNAVASNELATVGSAATGSGSNMFGGVGPANDGVAAPAFSLDDGPTLPESSFESFDAGASSPSPGFALADGPTDAKASPATRPSSRSQRSQRKSKSPLFEIMKVVIGGVVGLSGGYMILLWGFGKDPIPDMTRQVSQYVPAIIPAKFRDDSVGDGAENSGDQTPPIPSTLPPLSGAGDGSAFGGNDDDMNLEPDTMPAVFDNGSSTNDEDNSLTPKVDIGGPSTLLNNDGNDDPPPPKLPANDAEYVRKDFLVQNAPPFKVKDIESAITRAEENFEKWDESNITKMKAFKAMAVLGMLMPYADADHEDVLPLLPRIDALMKDQLASKDNLARLKFMSEETEKYLNVPPRDRTVNGIATVAKVIATVPRGKYYVSEMKIGASTFHVLSESPSAALTANKIIGLLGTIVDEPTTQIEGFTGSEPFVILLQDAVELK